MQKVLTRKFFERPALKVAQDLLGKFLCRRLPAKKSGAGDNNISCFMICEVEAYVGPQDKASHAHRGRTKRNSPMFGPAGRWYVYFTYGMHWMLNIVTGPKDYPAAVLIRGLSNAAFAASILTNLAQRDGVSRAIRQQANMRVRQNAVPRRLNGPARLTKFLKIDKRFNNKSATYDTGLWIEDRGVKLRGLNIKRTPRVGVDYAREWAKKKYRFIISP